MALVEQLGDACAACSLTALGLAFSAFYVIVFVHSSFFSFFFYRYILNLLLIDAIVKNTSMSCIALS